MSMPITVRPLGGAAVLVSPDGCIEFHNWSVDAHGQQVDGMMIAEAILQWLRVEAGREASGSIDYAAITRGVAGR